MRAGKSLAIALLLIAPFVIAAAHVDLGIAVSTAPPPPPVANIEIPQLSRLVRDTCGSRRTGTGLTADGLD